MSKKTPDDQDKRDWENFTKDIQKISRAKERQLYVERKTSVRQDQIHQVRRREYYENLKKPLGCIVSDSSIRKTLKVNKVVIEGRIDLHGLVIEQAQQHLQYFLMTSQLQKKLWVLVITGKGSPENEKTLRKLVPLWLDSLPYVSGYAVSKPADGGVGALYVRLKKI